MPPFTVRNLDHVVLRARDAPALVAFYVETLGCVVERELDVGLVQLRAGAVLIDIVAATGKLGAAGGPPPPGAGQGGRNLDHFCLRIDPFAGEALVAWLRGRGVTCSEVQEVYGAEGFGPSVYLTDPEGNTVELKGAATRGL